VVVVVIVLSLIRSNLNIKRLINLYSFL